MKKAVQSLLVAFLFLAGLPNLSFGQTTATFSTVGTTTWTCPAGVTSVQVECWGGGGAGGGVANVKYILAGGGAGGNYEVATVQVVPGTVYNIVVGAGGVGVLSPANGGSGSASSFAYSSTTLVSASGGPGAVANNTGGSGSSAYTGTAGATESNTSTSASSYSISSTTYNITGASTVAGSSGGAAGSGTNKVGGAGGAAANPATGHTTIGGAATAQTGNNSNGTAGKNYGGGGSGATNGGTAANDIGGNGAGGYVYLTYTVATTPTVTPTASLSSFTYAQGSGPSASQSFTITGSSLTGFPANLTVTAPADFEVSTDAGTTWSGAAGTASIAYPAATLSSQTIMVRLVAGKSAASFGPENISITGGGLSSAVTVAVSGSVTNSPLITPSVSSLTGLTYAYGSGPSTASTFTITASTLSPASGTITITGSTDYEVSTTLQLLVLEPLQQLVTLALPYLLQLLFG